MGLDAFDKETARMYNKIPGATPYTPTGPLLARKVRPKPKPKYNALDAFKTQSPQYYGAAKSVKDNAVAAVFAADKALNTPGMMLESAMKNGVRNSSADMYKDTSIIPNASESVGTWKGDQFISAARNERMQAAALPSSSGPSARPRIGEGVQPNAGAPAFAAPNYNAASGSGVLAPGANVRSPAAPTALTQSPVAQAQAQRPVAAQPAAPVGNGSYWIDSSGVKRDLAWDSSGKITSGLRNGADPAVQRDREANNIALKRSM